MYLTSTTLVHYLLARGHLSRSAAVHKPFSVLEIDGHHRCFRVVAGDGEGLFLKQLRVPDRPSIDGLRREASCYQIACSAEKFAAWRDVIPAVIHYDAERHVVILQRIADAEQLVECHRRLRGFPTDLAQRLASTVAMVHQATRHVSSSGDAMFLSAPPWVFDLESSARSASNPALRQVAELVCSDQAWVDELARCRDAWAPEQLIHGDLKWSNCLVSSQPDGSPQLYLVDWELASWGDPLWDVAAALEGYVIEPLLAGNPFTNGQPVALQAPEFHSLVQPALRRFWTTYCQCALVSPQAGAEPAVRCMRYLGARLLQATVELRGERVERRDTFDALLRAGRALLCEPAVFAAAWLGGAAD